MSSTQHRNVFTGNHGLCRAAGRWLAAAWLVLLSPEARTQSRDSAMRTATAADAALRRGDLAAAEELLRPLVDAPRLARLPRGERLELLDLWSEVLLRREDPESALAVLTEAREAAAEDREVELTLRLADCLLAVSDPDSARRSLESLSAVERKRPRARFLSAVVDYALEDREKAGRQFAALLEEESIAEAAHYLGVLAYERGAREEALKQFSTAIDRDPGDYYSRIYRGRCLLDLDRVTEAERELREVKEHRPTPEVRCLLGRALMRQRRDGEALVEFRGALRDQPSYAEALFGEAGVLRRLGRAEEARVATERFRQVHLQQEDDRRRLEALHQKSLRSPKDWRLRRESALLSRHAGDLEAAERHAWTAIRLAPGELSCRLLLARVLVDQGRYQAAAVQYQKILKRDPEHAEARAELERLVREHARGPR